MTQLDLFHQQPPARPLLPGYEPRIDRNGRRWGAEVDRLLPGGGRAYCLDTADGEVPNANVGLDYAEKHYGPLRRPA